MDLSIVILNYKTPELSISCIRSLERQYSKEFKNQKFEIIVVDNASDDQSFEKIKKYTDGKEYIKFLESGSNLGFAKGCNFGASKAKGSFVLFLNSDTSVEDRGISKMFDFIRTHAEVGILGGRLENADGTPQKSTGRFYTLFNFLIMIIFGERAGFLKRSPSQIGQVDWVTGGCMMVNKKMFDELGGFNKDIFMYVEDMELCFRAKTKSIKTYFYSDVKIKHVGQGSSNRGFAIINIYKGLLLFYKKYMNVWQYQIVKVCLFLKALIVYIIGKLTNNTYYINTYGEALKLFR